MSPRILVVDDEPAMRRVLGTGLRARGYEVDLVGNGGHALEVAALEDPDVVILDLGLPDLDGVEVCRRLRGWSEVPIIVLSAHGEEARKVEALDEGANDFVTKPFSMPELLARIRVALRYKIGDESSEHEVQVGRVRIDLSALRAFVDGEPVDLTDTEFRILVELVRNVGKVVTHQMLLRAVWGPGYQEELHYLRVYVSRLRKKIEPDPVSPRLLVTVPRVGYRLEPGEPPD